MRRSAEGGSSLRLLGLTNFFPPDARGGYGEICGDVMHGLAARGHEVTVLVCRACRGGSGDTVDVRRELDYVLAPWRRPRRGFQAVVHDQGVVRRALAEGVDAALVWHMRGVMKTSLRLIHDAGVPVLYMLHDRWVLYERPGPWLAPWPRLDRLGVAGLRELVGSVAAPRVELRAPPIAEKGIVCFVSGWLRDEHARLGWRPRRARVVPCGVDQARFRDSRHAPVSRPPRSILFAGRVDPTKGLEVALRALAEASTPLELTIAGPENDPSYARRLRTLSREVGLDGQIRWLGELPRADVINLLGSHDVLVYPSTGCEAYSLGLIEGFAAEILVITSARGGPQEYLRHGKNSLVFQPGDAGGLAVQLSRLKKEPWLIAELTQGARSTAERLSLESVLIQVESIISEAVA